MTLEATQRRRHAVSAIHDIVGAMRAIAAGRIQAAQHALDNARHYEQIVLQSLAWLAPLSPIPRLPEPRSQAAALFVFTSEQPLCGSFNRNVLDLAEKRLAGLGPHPCHVVVIGDRGSKLCTSRGLAPAAFESSGASLPALRDVVKRLSRRADDLFARGAAGSLHVVYNRYQSVTEQVPTSEQILPLDLDRFRSDRHAEPPSFHRYLSAAPLLAGAVGEYAFINLYRIAADSYAGEQASRLVAMDSATRNTERMRDSLIDLERREHQGQTTRQVLELLSSRFTAC